MELRSKKTIGWLIVLAAAPVLFAQQAPLEYQVRHDHWRKGCDGVLAVTADGVSFSGAKKHAWSWKFDDIEQLEVSDRAIRVTTYHDRLSRLGMDQTETFELQPGQNPRTAYDRLRVRLDQRFVAALADNGAAPLAWEMPAKLLGTVKGSEGMLQVAADRIVYKTAAREKSRTWRLSDIDNISRTGPFRLTVVTFERGRAQYGDRREFNFQLKRPLPDAQYDALWQQLNQNRGLKILTSYQENAQ